jgi:hypothetical protein
MWVLHKSTKLSRLRKYPCKLHYNIKIFKGLLGLSKNKTRVKFVGKSKLIPLDNQLKSENSKRAIKFQEMTKVTPLIKI